MNHAIWIWSSTCISIWHQKSSKIAPWHMDSWHSMEQRPQGGPTAAPTMEFRRMSFLRSQTNSWEASITGSVLRCFGGFFWEPKVSTKQYAKGTLKMSCGLIQYMILLDWLDKLHTWNFSWKMQASEICTWSRERTYTSCTLAFVAAELQSYRFHEGEDQMVS